MNSATTLPPLSKVKTLKQSARAQLWETILVYYEKLASGRPDTPKTLQKTLTRVRNSAKKNGMTPEIFSSVTGIDI